MAVRSTPQPGTGMPPADFSTGIIQLYLLHVMPIILTFYLWKCQDTAKHSTINRLNLFSLDLLKLKKFGLKLLSNCFQSFGKWELIQ